MRFLAAAWPRHTNYSPEREGSQDTECSSRLGFNICKGDTTGYFEGGLGTISSLIYSAG